MIQYKLLVFFVKINSNEIFNASVDYIIGNTDIRMSAERFSSIGLSEDEIKLLDIFKTLTEKDRQRAIGIVFALSKL